MNYPKFFERSFVFPEYLPNFVGKLFWMVMNLATSTTPFFFGIMADKVGIAPTIWSCIGISFAAGIINVPLMFKKGFGIPPKVVPPEARPLKFEDEELVEKALQGELISMKEYEALNEIRRVKGKPYLIASPGNYKSDKLRLADLRAQAKDDYIFTMQQTDGYIAATNKSDDLQGLLNSVNKAYEGDPELIKKANAELGQWFADYLQDAG